MKILLYHSRYQSCTKMAFNLFGILWVLYCCSVLPDLILKLKALPKFRTPKPPLTSARPRFELWWTSPQLISNSLLSG
nr:hypothetical protein CFP56_42569 [Quercus suber]